MGNTAGIDFHFFIVQCLFHYILTIVIIFIFILIVIIIIINTITINIIKIQYLLYY